MVRGAKEVNGLLLMDAMASKRLERLRQQREKLDAQIKLEQQKERAAARKLENKRKILLGAFLLYRLGDGQTITVTPAKGKTLVIRSEDDLRAVMDEFLSRPADRKAFGLDEVGGDVVPADGAVPPVSTAGDNVVPLERPTHTAADAAVIGREDGTRAGKGDEIMPGRLRSQVVSDADFLGLGDD